MNDRFQILSLDGGGIKGLFSAAILTHLEEDLGINIIDHFDLIVGTSTGGIIALGLGAGMKPKEIVNFYVKEGPNIFPKSIFSKIKQLVRNKYDSFPLEVALKKCFGDKTLGESQKRLVIPAYNIGEDDVYLFKTPHHKRLTRDWKVPMWKVALATSAAPTYFPTFTGVDNIRLVDGGVWANNPTMVGIVEAVSMFDVPLSAICVLSLGTTSEVKGRPKKLDRGGFWQWKTEAVDVIMRGQSIGAFTQAQHLLGRDKVAGWTPRFLTGCLRWTNYPKKGFWVKQLMRVAIFRQYSKKCLQTIRHQSTNQCMVPKEVIDMDYSLKNQFSKFLQHLAESLDISETQYETAVKHYEAVGKWLSENGSPIAEYEPQIYPQGSFRLGTMIKPINDTDEYDIDLVCELKALRKENVTQKQLKDMIGDRLKANERYRKMLKEGKRCWTLQYSDSARFHMDILPAIPDDEINEIAHEIGANLAESAILITDRELYNWQRSNPVGYTEWFKERMRIQFNAKRMLLAESLRASVEDVPEYKVKTPLQQSIQILKRHRDIMFMDDKDDKPISIIITTLAARAYDNEADLLEALQNIIAKMPNLIERDNQGNALVANPVNPLENFADKWKKHPEKEVKFRQWLQQVQADLEAALRVGNIRDMIENLKPRFGDRIVNKAASDFLPDHSNSVSAIVSVVPSINITKPTKPWGLNE